MNEHFDPQAALHGMGHPDHPSKPVPAPAEAPAPPATPVDRRTAALEIVAAYRREHPGDPRTDDQLLVAPYGGYELLERDPHVHPECLRRLAESRPKPPSEPAP